MTRVLIAAAAALIVLVGCSGEPTDNLGPSETAVAAPSTVAPVATPTPTEAETPEATGEETDVECMTEFLQPDVRIFSAGYELVDASRGQDDHAKYVGELAEEADDLADDVDECVNTAIGAAAAHVNFELSILNGFVVATGGEEAKASYYRDVKKAGQELFDAVGITDQKFGDGF